MTVVWPEASRNLSLWVPRSGSSARDTQAADRDAVSLAQQNCMVMAEQSQVWVGSEDSVIYIINVHSMSCNKQLTDHRSSVTGLAVQDGVQAPRCGGLYWVGRCLAHGRVGIPDGRVLVAVGDGRQGLDWAGGVKQVWQASQGMSLRGSGCEYREAV